MMDTSAERIIDLRAFWDKLDAETVGDLSSAGVDGCRRDSYDDHSDWDDDCCCCAGGYSK